MCAEYMESRLTLRNGVLNIALKLSTPSRQD